MKKVIVAVSGGPDSMALLDMLYQSNKYECIVAHVNYQQRDSAERDQNIIKEYADKHGLMFEVIRAPKTVKGNFQAFAREFRYQFFIDLHHKYKCNEVYLGHHQDDLIETYIMQKQRNITPSFYGLNECVIYKNLKLKRPLLKFSKEDLIKYCQKRSINFGIDESNLTDNYQRNKVRHQIVNKLSSDDKKALLQEISDKNNELMHFNQKVNQEFLMFELDYSIDTLIHYPDEMYTAIMRKYLNRIKIHNISQNELYSIRDYLKSQQGSKYKLNDQYYLFDNYGKLDYGEFSEDYKIELNSIEYGNYQHFTLEKSGKSTEAVTLKSEDFPITVRNFQPGDTIQMRFGNKKVSRWFIDRQIPLNERDSWPIMLNKKGDIILVPGLGCNIDHYSTNPSVFMVK